MNLTSPSSPIYRAYTLLVLWASKLQSPLLLAIRLYWGWQFCLSGWGKLFNHQNVTSFFISLDIPLPGMSAWLVAVTEFVGGLCLLLGFGTRLAALPLICAMVVALLTDDIDKVKMLLSDSGKLITATPFSYLLASVILLVFGPGVFSMDYLLARRFGRGRATQDDMAR